MQNHKTQNNGEYRNVAVELLAESPSNPRKGFNEESLKELVESLKSRGFLNRPGGRSPRTLRRTEHPTS